MPMAMELNDVFDVLDDELSRDETHTHPGHMAAIESFVKRVKESLASFGHDDNLGDEQIEECRVSAKRFTEAAEHARRCPELV